MVNSNGGNNNTNKRSVLIDDAGNYIIDEINTDNHTVNNADNITDIDNDIYNISDADVPDYYSDSDLEEEEADSSSSSPIIVMTRNVGRGNVFRVKDGKVYKDEDEDGEESLGVVHAAITNRFGSGKSIERRDYYVDEDDNIDHIVVDNGRVVIDSDHRLMGYKEDEHEKVKAMCIPIKVIGVGNRVSMKRVYRSDAKCNPVDLVTRVNTKNFMNMVDGVDTTGVLSTDLTQTGKGTRVLPFGKPVTDLSQTPVGLTRGFEGVTNGVSIEGYDTSVTSKRKFRLRKEHKQTLQLGFMDYVKFDVGKSHTIGYRIPSYIDATVDASSTTLSLRIRIGVDSFYDYDSDLSRVALGNLGYKLCKLRKRSPYTGNGIVWVEKNYPPLKSTKVAKK